MADQTILQETLDNNIVDGDWLIYWKTSTGVQRRVARSSLLGATLTGSGTIATGGFTLTVPATGTAALKTGTPTAGQVAQWDDANTVESAGFAASDVARLSQSNTFTVGNQQVTASSASNQALRLKAAANPTVPVLDVRNSSDAIRHELVADYGTNIVAARTMTGYQEFTIAPGNIQTNTLTVDIVGGTFPQQAVYMEVIGVFTNNTDNSTNRATFVDDVVWRTRLNASTTATIDASTRRISDIGTATVNGPTAITNGAGIRYTVQGVGTNLVRTFMYIRVVSQTAVTVTATVA